MVDKHNRRMSETFGHFSRNSPDNTQYLPHIKPTSDRRLWVKTESQKNLKSSSKGIKSSSRMKQAIYKINQDSSCIIIDKGTGES